MTTAADIMKRAAIVLVDTLFARWTPSELAIWITAGQRDIVLAKPNACSRSVPVELVQGTRQVLPTAATPRFLQLISLTRNLQAAEPRVGGRVITLTSRESLDREEPNWHDPRFVRQKREVRQYVFDEGAPLEFYVYPGNDGSGLVEAVCSFLPTDIVAPPNTDANDVNTYAAIPLSIEEIYTGPLLDYVLFRAYSKDDGPDESKSQAHYQLFATAVGLKIQVEAANSPNARKGVTTS